MCEQGLIPFLVGFTFPVLHAQNNGHAQAMILVDKSLNGLGGFIMPHQDNAARADATAVKHKLHETHAEARADHEDKGEDGCHQDDKTRIE